jgi:peptidoglycan/xylan/chitin deacetylase (PgdA/CDA1 family)
MRASACVKTIALALAASLSAVAVAHAACGPQAIGVKRVIEIDAKGGPRYGLMQYPGADILQEGEVVLTFDDGPHKLYTPQILAELDRHCAKATFFMVGQRALSFPEDAREVARRGHTIGTHTWRHQDLAKIDSESARSEIELGVSAVQKLVGQSASPFFRFPYLSDPKGMQAHLRARDTAMFSIDVDSYDFRTRSPTKVISNVMRQLEAKRRGIILFHDIQPSTAGAIGQLLTELKNKGYRVVHLISKQPQVSLAEYDRRIDRDGSGKRVAGLPPVSQRSIVAPAWEPRLQPASAGRPPPGQISSYPAPAIAPPALPPPAIVQAPEQRAPRPRDESDWKGSVFRGW